MLNIGYIIQTQGTGYMIIATEHRMHNTGYRTQDTEHKIQNKGYRTQYT